VRTAAFVAAREITPQLPIQRPKSGWGTWIRTMIDGVRVRNVRRQGFGITSDLS
jgi:hypothetical protein